MAFPLCNPINLLASGPRITKEKRHWDKDGYEQTERRNGAAQCPKCDYWWPVIESPDCWVENIETGNYDAELWWGGSVCELCDLLIIDQPDGSTEVYDISSNRG